MAESAISFVAQKLSDLIVQKAALLKGVEGQVEWLRDELQRMQCFLKDADARQEADAGVKNWVSEIRNAAYDAEDVIDTFILKIESQKNKGFFQRYLLIFRELNNRRKVGKEIKSLELKLHEISESRERYGIRSVGEAGSSSTTREKLRQIRRSSPLSLEKDVIGLQKDRDQLVAHLRKKEDGFVMISIEGMGGIGKTTLAKRVFNHDAVRAHFNCQAWAFVSQEWRHRDILQTILRGVTGEIFLGLEEEALEQMLYERLQGKCYLVVLDDVWTTEAWDVLERAFPKTNNGSKLLLTTRNRDVARHADARSISHELRPLSEENSWELFIRKAFIGEADTTSTCPPELEEVAREIVKKCSGLPLAIVVIGGLLSKKRLVSEWGKVLNNIDSHFARGQNGVLPKLALSYSDLPHYLKSCFLHLGIFPEDSVISTRKLIQLWIAEGLIPQRAEERMESIAEDYLNELSDRNMVQVVTTSVNNRIKQCQIHDLLRNLSISKAKEEIHAEIDFAPSPNCRHQAIYSNWGRYFQSKPSIRRLRSLLLFRDSPYSFVFIPLSIICTSSKLLRVLDLENIRFDHLPSEIGQLINLRYLGLRSTGIRELPSSMRYLRNLQTLDISRVYLDSIPYVICKMENLRHLYMNAIRWTGQLKIYKLRHLQTLLWVHVDNWEQNNSENLRSLLKLGVKTNISNVDEFFSSIAKLEHLLSLHLVSETRQECFSSLTGLSETRQECFPSLTGLSHLQCLTKLRMDGQISMLPRPRDFPPNLTQLTLFHSRLIQSAMSILTELPKLLILRLMHGSYVGGQLEISATWFPRLQFLELKDLEYLKELKIENGAMPRLRRFRILNCSGLTELHSDWTAMSALQELEIARTGLQINEVPSGVGVHESSPGVGVGDQ